MKGKELLTWMSEDHKQAGVCPGCKLNVINTAVVKLVYKPTECNCEKVEYTHLVDQLWHETCFIAAHAPKLNR